MAETVIICPICQESLPIPVVLGSPDFGRTETPGIWSLDVEADTTQASAHLDTHRVAS